MSGVSQFTDSRAAALGFAQRRSWVFYSWWYPAVLGLAGAVHAGLALAVGEDPELGTALMILGAALSAAGWAVTAKPRFTRKHPRPASDIPRVDQGIRITPGIIWAVLIGTAVLVLALVLFTPKGASPETLPVLGLLVTFAAGISAGLAYVRRLMANSAELYARWLHRKQAGQR